MFKYIKIRSETHTQIKASYDIISSNVGHISCFLRYLIKSFAIFLLFNGSFLLVLTIFVVKS